MTKPDQSASRPREHYGVQEDLTFYRQQRYGKVHVLREKRPNPLVGDGGSLLAAIYAHWVARCGRRHVWDPMRGTVSAFPDEDLCAACVRATPEDGRVALFEHPVE